MYTYLATALIAAAMAAFGTWRVEEWRYAAMERDRIEAAQEVERMRAHVADNASASHEGFRENERVVYKTITQTVDRIVDRPVYRNVCIDADGLQSLRAAIHGSDADTSKPAPAVPGAKRAD